MSVSLERHVGLEPVTIEPENGTDAQGKPDYSSPYEVAGRVVRGDQVVRVGGGTETKSVAQIWIGADQVLLPNYADRVTLADGLVGTVILREEGRSLRGQLDHIMIHISPVLG